MQEPFLDGDSAGRMALEAVPMSAGEAFAKFFYGVDSDI